MKNRFFTTTVTIALITASNISYGRVLQEIDSTSGIEQSSPISPKEQSRLSATIKSRVDLDRYQELAAPLDSPLNRLPEANLKRFLSSLTFNEKGMTGYSYAELQRGLTATEIHQVLSLFGAQSTTSLIRGAEVRTELDQELMSGVFFLGTKKFTPTATVNLKSWPPLDPWDWGAGTDYHGYMCESRANCKIAATYICMSSC